MSKSGWPWMKDVELSPITSENPNDDNDIIENDDDEDPRPFVKDLVKENRELIDKVQKSLASTEAQLYDPAKHDDLWILRFLLSHKKDTQRALKAAKTTLAFRKKHTLDERDIRAFAPQDRENIENKAFQRFANSGEVGLDALTLVVPDQKRYGVVFYFNIGSINSHELSKVDPEDWVEGMCYVNEWQFQWNDYITRTTGRLTKAVHIVDVAALHYKIYNNTTQEKYTTACKILQDCYPQGVQAYLVCHAPVWIQAPWRILKPLLPKRVVSKLDFLNPNRSDKDRLRLLQYTPENLLPQRFGGKYEVWPPEFLPKLK